MKCPLYETCRDADTPCLKVTGGNFKVVRVERFAIGYCYVEKVS